MRKILLIFCLFFAPLACAQGVFVPPQTAFKVVNGYTTPIANATITVCAANASGIPCSPALVNAIFKDAALTQALSNPFTSDAFGNYQFAVAGGTYTVTVTALGFAGYSYQVPAGGGGSFGIPNPLNATNLNVSNNTNLNGFTSTGPGSWQNGFPAFGAPFDPFCAYMVPNAWWQICVFPDPNNGSGVLAFNDGVGTPNVNRYPMMTDTLPSFQPQGVVNCWNQATMTMSFSIPCKFVTNVVMNTGSNGSGITVGQESDITITDPGNSGLTGPNIYGNIAVTDVGPNAHISTVGGYRVRLPQFEAGSVTQLYYPFSLYPATPLGTIVNSAVFFTGNNNAYQYGLVASGGLKAIIANDATAAQSGICHGLVSVDLPITALHDCYFSGTGSPNGVVTANLGSIYSRQDGGVGTSVYVKETGSGNTGWDAVQPILSGTPTVSACGGGSPAVSAGTTYVAFRVTIGTGAVSSCTINLPSNANGWNCSAADLTTTTAAVFLTKQVSAGFSTSITLQNFNTSGVGAAWTASDILSVNCSPVL